MPKVFVSKGNIKEVDGALFRDFMNRVVNEDVLLEDALMQFKTNDRIAIGDYIIYRLAEVDPGYVRT